MIDIFFKSQHGTADKKTATHDQHKLALLGVNAFLYFYSKLYENTTLVLSPVSTSRVDTARQLG